MRYTEYHEGVAVIRDKNKHKEAMKKLAEFEDAEMIKCNGCRWSAYMPWMTPCKMCSRNKEDLYEKSVKNEVSDIE